MPAIILFKITKLFDVNEFLINTSKIIVSRASPALNKKVDHPRSLPPDLAVKMPLAIRDRRRRNKRQLLSQL